jgi:hypothetical protein
VKSSHKWLAGGTAAVIATLLWPGPGAYADTSLGGYTAVAEASVVHFEIYDPVIPIPSDPQIDASVGYTKSSVDSGPTSRALSSYLWPGVTIGDGFDQLLKKPGTKYPVQTNSRYPETTDAPAKNAVQLTDGNGMTTSTDGLNTRANVTLLGISGPDTNLLGGIGSGLGQLSGKTTGGPKVKATNVPLPVSAPLAALVQCQNLTSTSTVNVADKTVTSEAHASVSTISLLGGLVKVNGLDVDSKIVSDGTKATSTASSAIASISVAGLRIPIDDQGVNLGLPVLSSTVSSVLKTLGVELATIPVTKNVDAANGSATAQGLQISIDTKPLKSVLNSLLDPLVAKIPKNMRDQLQPILDLAPKFVITLGNSNAMADASPAYDGGSIPPVTSGGDSTGTAGGTTGTTGTTGTIGGDNSPLSPGTGTAPTSGTVPIAGTTTTAPTAFRALPALGDVPRMLILGGLVLAAAIGWAMRRAGGLLLGGARNCDFGLATGVPDLRKG